MDLYTQKTFNCFIGKHYPKPVVDHTDAIKQAKLKLALILRKDGYRQGSNIVLKKLGNKKVKKNQKKTHNQLEIL